VPDQAPDLSITLEGDVALAGSSALDQTLVLSDDGGSVCILSSPRYELELRSLAGQRVRVTGRITGKAENVPEFLVDSYEMAPVNGRAPLIGALVARGTALVLHESRTGTEYLLSGLLVEALRAHTGSKVWVDGPLTPAGGKEAAGGTIAVEGYGIIARPTEATSGRP
jgi:RNase P/RNase MRP subunit p29